MAPLFRAGGIALVEPRPAEPRGWLSPGDCAVYRYRGRSLLHRVLETRRDGALLSDDAGRLQPHFVPWGEVAGRVISRNPLKKGVCGLAYSRLKRLLSPA